MNDLVKIKVECHSGYKAGEYPIRFYWEDVCIHVKTLLDRWYQYDAQTEFTPANYFKVLSTDEKTYLLKHEQDSDTWFLWIKGESLNL